MSIRIRLGWGFSLIWSIFWAALLFCRWDAASIMPFNEWGDFFAGASAPLAFLWLVIGYFQQGDELSQNTKALEQQEKALQLQVDELRQSVEQQNKSAVALSQQSSISGMMGKLEAINRILDTLDRKIKVAKESNSANASQVIKGLSEKQKKYESSIETILSELESIGDN